MGVCKVVGYRDAYRNGVKYLKGDDGTVCFRHHTDPRISRSIFVKKFNENSYQTNIRDYNEI